MSVLAPVRSVQLRVPFLDLKPQYLSIQDEIQHAIRSVLDSCHFVGGRAVETFEEEFAASVGARFAVAVANGTDALELALKAAGVSAGDEVIVPANSFFATAEAVSNIGAVAVFVDVDSSTFHLDHSLIERAITPKTRAIIPVHLYGRAADLAEIERLAAGHHLEIIEDACQAHGVSRGGVPVGASGRLTCFSFYPGKNLGAYGDGGAVTTSDEARAKTLRMLRDHGSPAKYEHVLVGMNSRLDALQAAILSVKLRHLANWNALRVRHATRLAERLEGTAIIPPEVPAAGEHNFHLFVVRSKDRDRLRNFLKDRAIDTGIHYPVPLHLTPAYQNLNCPSRGSFPVAEALAGEILSLPMYPELSGEQVEHVLSALEDFSAKN
ncbi:MAG: erythromycin biosynthesis sensory transduction protein eryC1 [Proteobacteria bacterium]|nr:MAG: erythromycin biosynthesis sensory transduction protein eryC1 [Pseudomonadota bacterium]